MSRQGPALIAFGLGIVVAPLGWVFTTDVTTAAIAQDGGNEDLIDVQPGEPKDLKSKPRQARAVEEQPVDDQPNPVAIYLDLAKQKAELLTPEELAHETQALRRELLELQATLKLRKAEQQLQQLIDEHPESNAARRAKTLLEVLRNPIDPNLIYGTPELTPTPDDDFAPVPQRTRTTTAEPVAPDNFNRRIGEGDPFAPPTVRSNAPPVPPAQPTKKTAPSFSPNRT